MADGSAARRKQLSTADAIWRLIRSPRGAITLFVLALIPMLLAFTGLAVDLALYMMAQNELKTTMDAAALAGAGALGFNTDGNLTAATNAALHVSQYNGKHLASLGQPPVLDAGDITLGVWDPITNPVEPFRAPNQQPETNA